MGFSSRKWAEIISKFASRVYFFIIMLQLPLFRFPCRIGICQTPIDVTVCQLIASETFPQVVIKALLYPGAILKFFTQGTTIPSHDQLLNSYKSNIKEPPPTTDLKHLEVIAGSYLCVAGALLGLHKRGRMSLFGLALVVWGVLTEISSTGKHGIDLSEDGVCIYPKMMIAIAVTFCSMRRDLRKLIRICKFKSIAFRKLKNDSKFKCH
ncbi:hypothetical protein BUALT_Bualt07G0133300 [Buddleja alternifolia]|uniref:Uncharacterized protein n=1 Tax=Buddleja alternifolia TaxID=168488 RepID=A0AAV6XLC4_9LAMI|nr:hypothetical protein BUALT_Bualt07G0133300 [Buddleja alternifolia]